MSLIEEAKRVLKLEAQALEALVERVDERLERAVELILHCKGRVIVTGMGKPGFIAGKLAATLASTGTPSFALHPADATHGDLGMVTRDDIVIAISNSGETPEVLALLQTIKKIGATLISFAGNADSTLARHSDIAFDASVEQEACPMNLAPTTSTTAALALGDALAVALIMRRDFKPEDFAFLHPGGNLGKKLLRVADIMRTGNRLPQVPEKAPAHDAIIAITRARAGCCIVTDDGGRLSGIFTDGDLRRYVEEHDGRDFATIPIADLMTRNPLTLTEDRLAAEAFALLRERKIDELPVVNTEGAAVGLLDVQDLLDAGFL